MNWGPHLTPPWSLTDLEGILEDALKVLQQIGVECTHPAARGGALRLAGRVHRRRARLFRPGARARPLAEKARPGSPRVGR